MKCLYDYYYYHHQTCRFFSTWLDLLRLLNIIMSLSMTWYAVYLIFAVFLWRGIHIS